MRVKRGIKARKRRNRVFALAKGFRGRSGNTIRMARGRVEKALCYSYRDRKTRKRDFRKLWITRISAALTNCDLSYSQFLHALKVSGVELNRKILADLGALYPESFEAVVNVVRKPA